MPDFGRKVAWKQFNYFFEIINSTLRFGVLPEMCDAGLWYTYSLKGVNAKAKANGTVYFPTTPLILQEIRKEKEMIMQTILTAMAEINQSDSQQSFINGFRLDALIQSNENRAFSDMGVPCLCLWE